MQEYRLVYGTEEDIEEIISIFGKTLSLSTFSDTPISKDKVRIVTRNLLSCGLVLLAKKDKELVGIFLATTTEPWFSNYKVAVQVAWTICKDHRGKGLSHKMIEEYEEWAKDQNCDAVSLMHLGKDLTKLFEGKGYSKRETTFMKVL